MEMFNNETVVQVITTIVALIALAYWGTEAWKSIRISHTIAALYTVAPSVWLLNFLAYRFVSLYLGTPTVFATEVYLVWAAVIRLHSATTLLIMALSFRHCRRA
jgi:hypothetical protein